MQLHETSDYKAYLNHVIDHGLASFKKRIELAKIMRCQPGFVTQVLSGEAHLSLEQAILASEAIGHNVAERRYFLLMIQFARAGSEELKSHFEHELRRAREEFQQAKTRLRKSKQLSESEAARYYSQWFMSALHVLCALPRFQAPAAMAEKLKLPIATVRSALGFLEEVGMVKREGNEYRMSETLVHLGADSPLVNTHHRNWRLEAMNALGRPSPEHLHFSSALGISRKDATRIRELLLSSLTQIDDIVGPSKEEDLWCLNIDWFTY